MTLSSKSTISLQPELTIQEPQAWFTVEDYARLLYWSVYFPQAPIIYHGTASPSTISSPTSQHSQSSFTSFVAIPLVIQIAALNILLLLFSIFAYWGGRNFAYPQLLTIQDLLLGCIIELVLFLGFIIAYWSYKHQSLVFAFRDLIYHIIYVDILLWYLTVFMIDPSVFSSGNSFTIYAGSLIGIYAGFFWRIQYAIHETIRSVIQFVVVALIYLILNVLANYLALLNLNLPDSTIVTSFQLSKALIIAIILFLIMGLRVDDWIIGIWRCDVSPQKGIWRIPHVTVLPFPRVLNEVERQLRDDWDKGLEVAQYVMGNSYQKPYVVQCIKRVLYQTPKEKILERVMTLHRVLDNQRDFFQFRIPPENLSSLLIRYILSFFRNTPDFNKTSPLYQVIDQSTSQLSVIEKPIQAVIEGVWHLSVNAPKEAHLAFERINDLEYGGGVQELLQLSEIFRTIFAYDDVVAHAPLRLPLRPNNAKFESAWDALNDLETFVRFLWIYRYCSRTAKRTAITYEAQLQLKKVQQKLDSMSNSSLVMRQIGIELKRFVDIWSNQLMSGQRLRKYERQLTKNPFIFVEPMRFHNLPPNRQQEISRIRKVWVLGNLEPIIIYGQQKVGKTSIIFAIETQKDIDVELIYLNLLHLGATTTVRRLFFAIGQEIALKTFTTAPSYEDLQRNPHQIFQAYVRYVCSNLQLKAMIIVFDEFEHIENIAGFPNVYNDVLQFLWELSQTEPRLGFVFITDSIPEEMKTKFITPFVTGAHRIKIGHLSRPDVSNLLRNPDPDFLPYFTQEAVDKILELTDGHPYLVQVIAHCVVEFYHTGVEKNNEYGDPLFVTRDIENIVETEPFKQLLAHYCEQAWGKIVGRNGQNGDLLRTLACNQAGFTDSDIRKYQLDLQLLDYLTEHGVIRRSQNRWQICVELFRRWIVYKIAMMYKITAVTNATTRQQFCSYQNATQLTIELLRQHQPTQSWVLINSQSEVLARCSIWLNGVTNTERIGFIGHFGAQNLEVATQILKHACSQLSLLNCTEIVGPLSGDILRGFLFTDDFILGSKSDTPNPSFFLDHNNKHLRWPPQWKECGFAQIDTYYHSAILEIPNDNLVLSTLRKYAIELGITVRKIDFTCLKNELGKLYKVLVKNFADDTYQGLMGESEFVYHHQQIAERYRSIKWWTKSGLIF